MRWGALGLVGVSGGVIALMNSSRAIDMGYTFALRDGILGANIWLACVYGNLMFISCDAAI